MIDQEIKGYTMIYNFKHEVEQDDESSFVVSFIMSLGNSEMDCSLVVSKDMPIDETLPEEVIEFIKSIM